VEILNVFKFHVGDRNYKKNIHKIYLNFHTVLDQFCKIQWSLPYLCGLNNRLCHKILFDSTTIRKYRDINI